jgi:hypothetical protein
MGGSGLVTVETAEVPWNFRVAGKVATQLKATYYDPNNREYQFVEVRAYPVNQFPDLTTGATPDRPLNMTSVAAIPRMDWMGDTEPNIAGRQQQDDDVHVAVLPGGAAGTAVILGKSEDGKKQLLLVTVQVIRSETSERETEKVVKAVTPLLSG